MEVGRFKAEFRKTCPDAVTEHFVTLPFLRSCMGQKETTVKLDLLDPANLVKENLLSSRFGRLPNGRKVRQNVALDTHAAFFYGILFKAITCQLTL
jgi:hypothetical protein